MSYRMTLSEAFKSPMTTADELRTIETGAILQNRLDIAAAARSELARRADESSRKPA